MRDGRSTAEAGGGLLIPHHPRDSPVRFSDALRSDQANAEVLLWQSRYRIAFLTAVGSGAVGLRMAGVLRPTPIADAAGGPPGHLALALVALAAYVMAIASLDWRVRRAGRAGRGAVTATTAADVLLGFTVVFLVTPPAYYARALILAFFSLQLTLTYFGRGSALVALGTIAASYVALVALARFSGADLAWPEELWTLALFTGGAALFVNVQGDLTHRLTRLVRMFERAEEGDFGVAYDVAADARPDGITLVGHA